MDAQSKVFKPIKQFFEYSTVYASGDIKSPMEVDKSYIIRTPNGLYSVPNVIDITKNHPFDYRWGYGIRKLARFDYEVKSSKYYKGTEDQFALSAPTSADKGFEYLFSFEKERERNQIFKNHRYFIRHTGKNWIVKVESRQVGKINLNVKSAEVRARLPIGNKFSINTGVIYRTHKRAYGYNPFEIWLNEPIAPGGTPHYWWSIGYSYGYRDFYTGLDNNSDGIVDTYTWIWKDIRGNQVANSDETFRDNVMPGIINLYNKEQWDKLNSFGVVSPVAGFDLYHYKDKFWIHAYGNILLPFHKYVQGDKNYNYTNRNNFGLGGLIAGSKPEQWIDYSSGLNVGVNIGKNIGIFTEGEYTKYWDTKLFQSSFGINYQFK